MSDVQTEDSIQLINNEIEVNKKKKEDDENLQTIHLQQEPESQKEIDSPFKRGETLAFSEDSASITTNVEEFFLDEDFDYENTPFVPKFSKEDMELMQQSPNSKSDFEIETNQLLKADEHLADYLPPL